MSRGPIQLPDSYRRKEQAEWRRATKEARLVWETWLKQVREWPGQGRVVINVACAIVAIQRKGSQPHQRVYAGVHAIAEEMGLDPRDMYDVAYVKRARRRLCGNPYPTDRYPSRPQMPAMLRCVDGPVARGRPSGRGQANTYLPLLLDEHASTHRVRADSDQHKAEGSPQSRSTAAAASRRNLTTTKLHGVRAESPDFGTTYLSGVKRTTGCAGSDETPAIAQGGDSGVTLGVPEGDADGFAEVLGQELASARNGSADIADPPSAPPGRASAPSPLHHNGSRPPSRGRYQNGSAWTHDLHLRTLPALLAEMGAPGVARLVYERKLAITIEEFDTAVRLLCPQGSTP